MADQNQDHHHQMQQQHSLSFMKPFFKNIHFVILDGNLYEVYNKFQTFNCDQCVLQKYLITIIFICQLITFCVFSGIVCLKISPCNIYNYMTNSTFLHEISCTLQSLQYYSSTGLLCTCCCAIFNSFDNCDPCASTFWRKQGGIEHVLLFVKRM